MLSKKILISALFGLGAGCAVSSAFATDFIQDAGPYLGVQGGWSKADYGTDIKNTFKEGGKIFGYSSSKEGGFGGRAFVGWQFDPFLSVEAGYTQFAQNKYSFGFGPSNDLDLKLKTNAWDMVGKLSLPFGPINAALNGFSIYGKAGGAYVTAEPSGDFVDAVNSNGGNLSKVHGWEPVAGAGLAYTFPNNIALDVSYTHIFGHKTDNEDDNLQVPLGNLAALGVSYKFDIINPTSGS
jgi:OOP family OmpA-OmpF porin